MQSMVRLVIGKTSARSSGKRKIRKQSSSRKRSPKGKEKGQGRRVKFDEVFPIHEVHRADLEERTFHMDAPLGWAVLDCGAAKSFCWRRACGQCEFGLARNVVAKEERVARLTLWKRSTIFVESENS